MPASAVKIRKKKKTGSYQDNWPPVSIDSVIALSSTIACSHVWWTWWVWYTTLFFFSSTSFSVLHLFIHPFCSIILLSATHNDTEALCSQDAYAQLAKEKEKKNEETKKVWVYESTMNRFTYTHTSNHQHMYICICTSVSWSTTYCSN